jgi:hypothetical protein
MKFQIPGVAQFAECPKITCSRYVMMYLLLKWGLIRDKEGPMTLTITAL